MPVLLGAILFRASRHGIDPRGSLENTPVDKTAFLHVSSISVSFQVWFTIKSHRGRKEEEPKYMPLATEVSLLTSSFGHLLDTGRL